MLSVIFNTYVFSWWLLIEILGLAALPIAYHFLRWLPDRGYIVSKALGLLIACYLLWVGAMTGFLRNDSGGILFAILTVFGLAALTIWLNRARSGAKGAYFSDFLTFLSQNKRMILVVELLFGAAFLVWVIVRAYAPDKVMNAGGEKFMEMAFLNGVLNSSQFPPLDPWLSGFAISYYYFGYVMMGLLTRFTAVPAGVGFELYDALLFALATLGVFGIVYNLVAHRNRTRPISNLDRTQSSLVKPHQPVLYGLLGGLMVVIMGNLEGLLESLYSRGLLPESFWRWIDIPGLINSPVTGSWVPSGGFFGCCWRASRVLQDYDLLGQPVGVSPITEFPNFSFLLGDNHPHILALPFVLLMIALAFNLLLRQQAYPINTRAEDSIPAPARLLSSVLPTFRSGFEWLLLLFYAFCLGALGFLNTWDMPIYLGLLTLAYCAGEFARQRKLDWMLAIRTFAFAVTQLIIAISFYILFYLGFQSQASGILPYVFQPTRLAQYLVMFGPFIFIILWFLITAFARNARKQGPKQLFSLFLSMWGWIILACVGLMLLFLGVIALLAGSEQLQNPVVQSVLGAGPILQVFQRFIGARLSNPWLFLLLSGMLALSLANLSVIRSVYGAPEPTDVDLPPATTENPPQVAQPQPSPSTIFAFLLILVGVALTLSVELFYLRDSFGVRMNTIFKFYYQAWIMLGCASAYGIYWVLNPTHSFTPADNASASNASAPRPDVASRVGRYIFLVSVVLLIGAGLVYPVVAGYTRVDGLRSTPNLDGTSNLARANPDDWAAIAWLKDNITGSPVILEAPGKSYNYEGRISAFSGFPTLLGWSYHEAQWRGNYDEQGRREPDIQTIYTTKSADQALELLRKWNIRYVIVGASEINYIQELCSDPGRACNLSRALRKFETVLNPVFQQGNLTIYEVPESYEP
jgi:YYY domain-containing protein